VTDAASTFTARLDSLQPSQLWISREKLDIVLAGRESLAQADVAPLPVKQLCDSLMLTDGHTRAVAAALSGLESIGVYWETDDLDWEAYEECVKWCRDEGIRSVVDLVPRIVSAEDYRRLWHDCCDQLHLELARRRNQTFEPQAGKRLWLRLDLPPALPVPELPCHNVTPSDADALADLMLDSYRGSVDYNGETLDDARAEIGRTIGGTYGRFLPGCSFVVEESGTLVSASLVTLLNEGQSDEWPLLAYSMTRPSARRRGLASALILRSAAALSAAGFKKLGLAVTAANAPARRVYDRLGFVPAD
jgi:GNAT superfamily N-acetyltransferase